MNGGGGVFGALVFVIGVLIAFAILFGFFLIVPFFVFLAGIVVMLVSDRKRGGGSEGGNGNGNGNGNVHPTVDRTVDRSDLEVVETSRTEVRRVNS